MFRQYGRKKRMKKMLLIVLIASIASYIALVVINNTASNSKTIAKVGSTRISQDEIKDKFLQLFNNSVDNGNFDIKKLPPEALKSLAKEVYLEKKLLESAKKSRIHKDPKVKTKITKLTNSIILESYLANLVKNNTTEKKINNKYLEISSNINGKKEYNISVITVNDKEIGNMIFEKLSNSESRFINYRFKTFRSKYSTNNREESGYVLETFLPGKVLQSFDEGQKVAMDETINKIKIYKINDVREATVPDLNEQYKEEIKSILTKEVMQKFIKKNLNDKEVTIFEYK